MRFPDSTQVELYVRSMGKMLRVTAVFPNPEEANAYMANHRDEGCVAELKDGTVLIANLYDCGLQVYAVKGKAGQ